MDDEMIDRVAKALFEHASVGHIVNQNQYKDIQERSRLLWRESAKIAINAMREPTQKMIYTAETGYSLEEGSSAEGCWQDMIDAIIGD